MKRSKRKWTTQNRMKGRSEGEGKWKVEKGKIDTEERIETEKKGEKWRGEEM